MFYPIADDTAIFLFGNSWYDIKLKVSKYFEKMVWLKFVNYES